jgi:hypothetical protein
VSDSSNIWRRVEKDKQIAQIYLSDHEPHYPKIYDLPAADWHLSRVSAFK